MGIVMEADSIYTTTVKAVGNSLTLIASEPIKLTDLISGNWSGLEDKRFTECIIQRPYSTQKYTNHVCNYHDIRIIWV